MNTDPQITFERAKQERLTRFNPIRNLTPAKLTSDLDSFAAGYLSPLARMIDAMKRRDDVIRVVASKREGAPARRNWEILKIANLDPGQEPDADRHKQALEYFYNNLEVTSAIDLDLRGGVRLLVRQVLGAIGFKYAAHHIVWRPAPDGLTAQLIHCPLWFFECRTGKLRFLANEFAWDGVEMEEGAWLVSVFDDYVMEACAVAYMFKQLPLKDWLIFSQDFGKPIVEGITDAAEGSPEWLAMNNVVKVLAADLRIVRSRSAEIKLTDINRTGEQPYAPLVDRMDRAITRLWRGGDLGTMSRDTDTVGAELQGDEKDLQESDDAQFVSETLNGGLDRWVLDYTFGPGVKPLAYFKLIVPERRNIPQEIAIDTFLRDSNAPLGIRATLERYNRQMPDAGEELLTRPAPAPMPSFTPAANEAHMPAAQQAGAADPELIQKAVAETLGVMPKLLLPLQPFLDKIERAAQDQSLSDSDLEAFLTQAADQLPELFGSLDVAALADILESAMGMAALEGVRESLRSNRKTEVAA